MIAIKQVDAFTEMPFGGNPAGVVTDARGLDERMMQKIASEMNLSETAFVTPCHDGLADFNVRFFTPAAEVDLCGHATIATFVTLAEEGKIPTGQGRVVVKQRTKAGILNVEVESGADRSTRALMTQAVPQFRTAAVEPELVAELLGLRPDDLLTEWPLQLAYTGLWHLMVPIKDSDAIDRAEPQLGELAALNKRLGVQTTHLIAPSPRASSLLYTRDFAPAVGISEDPATGTASGAMGAYLVHNQLLDTLDSSALTFEEHESEQTVGFVSLQGYSIDRPSQVTVEVRYQEHQPLEVKVGGSAVCMLAGSMRVR